MALKSLNSSRVEFSPGLFNVVYLGILFEMFPTPPNIQSSWFWDNYKKGMNWVSKHEIAYWKSQALSLAVENETLQQLIHDRNIQPTKGRAKSHRNNRRARKKKRHLFKETCSEISVEVTSELVEFFKTTIQHRAQLKKDKEEKELFAPPQETTSLRLKEMKELYGEGHTTILGMETAMQLSFERFLDQKSPVYWPDLPLNV